MPGRSPPPPSLGGLHVLVVDDQADARELLCFVLEQAGAKTTEAASAAEAFEQLQADRPDVVVSDVGLPGEDGYSFVRRVRALDAALGGQTPIVALTAYAEREDRERARLAGFTDHVPKPVDTAVLLTALAAAVGRRA